MRRDGWMPAIMTLGLAAALLGCGGQGARNEAGAARADTRPDTPGVDSDSAYAALQRRGSSPMAMGVDQYTSAHRFDDLPDGGRIELQREVEDPAGVERIREHLRHIAAAFAAGDFRIPAFVHDRADVPGTDVMTAKRAAIRYEFETLPRGAAVRISTSDPEAVQAIHRFLAFQRGDHHAAGHAMGGHAAGAHATADST